MRDIDIAVEIGKGVIDAGALAAGLVLTGPTGLFVGLGIDSLAIGLCVEHGDDEEEKTTLEIGRGFLIARRKVCNHSFLIMLF